MQFGCDKSKKCVVSLRSSNCCLFVDLSLFLFFSALFGETKINITTATMQIKTRPKTSSKNNILLSFHFKHFELALSMYKHASVW